jgi:type IV pilus assembly protein PilM
MAWFSFRKPFWGIDIGASSVKVVRLEPTRKGMRLLDIGVKELPTGERFRAENLSDALNELIRDKNKPKAVVNFLGKTPLIRYLSLPVMPKDELAEAVKWEAKKLVSFPMEEMLLDYVIVGGDQNQDGKRYELIMVVVEKNTVQEQRAMMNKIGLDLLAIDVNPLSLLSAVRFNYPDELKKNLIYIDIGAAKTDVAIVKEGVLRFTRRLQMGGEQITRRLEKELNISYDQAEQIKCEKGLSADEEIQTFLKEEIDRFIVEVQRSVDYYRAQFREAAFSKIILMGGGVLLPGFHDYFSSYFDSDVTLDDPFTGISGAELASDIKTISPRFSTGIGLALRGRC